MVTAGPSLLRRFRQFGRQFHDATTIDGSQKETWPVPDENGNGNGCVVRHVQELAVRTPITACGGG